MNRADLDTVVNRALLGLPTPVAPPTLLPRIMSAVQAWKLRPWYHRAWFTWPVAGQAAMLTGLIILASTAAVALSLTENATLRALSAPLGGVVARAAAIGQSVGKTAGAARIIWDSLIQPVVPYLFAVVVLMGFACAAFGAALKHVAFERT
jgi:hypothetical protein